MPRQCRCALAKMRLVQAAGGPELLQQEDGGGVRAGALVEALDEEARRWAKQHAKHEQQQQQRDAVAPGDVGAATGKEEQRM